MGIAIYGYFIAVPFPGCVRLAAVACSEVRSGQDTPRQNHAKNNNEMSFPFHNPPLFSKRGIRFRHSHNKKTPIVPHTENSGVFHTKNMPPMTGATPYGQTCHLKQIGGDEN
jgi:hypothetical protein